MLEMPNNNFQLNSFISNNNQIKPIPLNLLVEYHNHPFKLYTGERRNDMIESIRQNGVLNPIIVQPINNGKYEILSGHNRVDCAKQVGLDNINAIVKENLSEDEAEIYVMETNLMQRSFSELAVSEQATILKYRNSKMFSQGKRNDILKELEHLENQSTLSHSATKLKNLSSMEKLGAEYSMSKSQVARTIRISYLIPQLQELINTQKLLFMVGVELSYISMDNQLLIYNIIDNHHKKITKPLARKLRNVCTENDNITNETLESLIIGEKLSVNDNLIKISINKNVYSKYFDKKTSNTQVSDTIQKALDLYFNSKI